MNRQRTPARNNRGAAAMEFGLLATLIVVTIIAALAGVRQYVHDDVVRWQ